MDDVEAVPAVSDDTAGVGQLGNLFKDRRTVFAAKRARSDQDSRLLGTAQDVSERVFLQIFQGLRANT